MFGPIGMATAAVVATSGSRKYAGYDPDDEERAEMQTLKKNCILGLLYALLAGIAYSALMYFFCNQ